MNQPHTALKKNPKYSGPVQNDDKLSHVSSKAIADSTNVANNLGSIIPRDTNSLKPTHSSVRDLPREVVDEVLLTRSSSRYERSTLKDIKSDSAYMISSDVKKIESNYASPPRLTPDDNNRGVGGSYNSPLTEMKPAIGYLDREERKESFYPVSGLSLSSSNMAYSNYITEVSSHPVSKPRIDQHKEIGKLSDPKPVQETEMEIESEGGIPRNKLPESRFQSNDIQEKEKKAIQVKMKSDLNDEGDEKVGELMKLTSDDIGTFTSETVIGEDFNIKALRDEIKNYLPLLEEEMKRIINDVERMARGHSTKVDVLSSLKMQSEKTIAQIKKEISSLLDEAIPKLDSVQSKLNESRKSKNDLEKQKKELEEMAKEKPSHATEIRKSLEKTNAVLLTYKKEVEDLGGLRKGVQEKIMKSKESLKEQITKILEFYANITDRARNALEKGALTSVKVDEKKAQSVDLCFVLDCTESMKDYIKMVMEKVQDIIKTLKGKFGGFSIRIAVLGYRDVFDARRFEILDFRDNVEEVKKFLKNIEATGGDDVAEDVNGAFQKMLKLSWESSTRVVVHIADAPCHGRDFHELNYKKDSFYYEKSKGDADYEVLFESFKRRMLNYVFLKINKLTDKMFERFQAIYKRSGDKNSDLLFLHDTIKNDAAHFIKVVASHIGTSISITIRQTFKPTKDFVMPIKEKEVEALLEADKEDDKEAADAVVEGKKSYEKYLIFSDEVEYVEPKWEMEKFFNEEIHAKIYYLYNENRIKNIIQNKVTFSKETAAMVIKTKPFAKGGFNLAYYCKATPQISNKYYNMVLKRPVGHFDKAYYFSALKKNTMAITISNQFNKLLGLSKIPENERIYFTRVLVAKYAKKYYMLEAFIEGEIEKYTNNFTFVNERVPLMSAFSHFSYEFTKGKYMVADLQGSNNLLTDPVIHSFNIEFPNQGDMGLKGMLAFFRYHECNHYCKVLHLGEHEAQKDRADAILETPTKFSLKEYYQKCKFYYCNKNSKHEKLCVTCKKQIDMF